MLSDKHFLAIAQVIAEAGTCSRLQVGAVIVKDRRIISTGYNGAVAKMPHCEHTPGPDRYEAIMGGCTIAVHAEANAIAYAARIGISTDGASLYTTDSPCQKCAELIVNAGIVEVIFARQYRDIRPLSFLKEARVHIIFPDGSELRPLPAERGHGQSLYPSQHADPAFDEGWQAAADAHRGGSTGVPGGEDGATFFGSGRAVTGPRPIRDRPQA